MQFSANFGKQSVSGFPPPHPPLRVDAPLGNPGSAAALNSTAVKLFFMKPIREPLFQNLKRAFQAYGSMHVL